MAKKFDFKKIGMKVAGVGAGAVVGLLANKPLVNMNPKIRGAIKIAVGAVIPELMPKVDILDGVGAGIIASGAIDLYTSFTGGTVSGTDDDISGMPGDLAISGDEDYRMTGIGGDEIEGLGGDEEMSGLGAIEDNAIGETSEMY